MGMGGNGNVYRKIMGMGLCLAGMGMEMGLKLVEMGKEGKLKAIPAHL